MDISEKIFGRLTNNVSFIKDILFLDSLHNKLTKILDIYLNSQYRNFYHYGNKFAKLVDITEEDSHRLWHLIDLFGYHIVPDFTAKEIIDSLNRIAGKELKITEFIERLKEDSTQVLLKDLDLIDDNVGNINPQYAKLGYNIEERKIIKNDKVFRELPIITIQVITTSEDSDKNAFEFLEDDIDRIIEEFGEIKKKLKIISKK